MSSHTHLKKYNKKIVLYLRKIEEEKKIRKWKKNLPSICFPATIEAVAVRLLFVSGVGEYNPPVYCGNAAVV